MNTYKLMVGAGLILVGVTQPLEARANEQSGFYGSLGGGLASVNKISVDYYDTDGALGLGKDSKPDGINGAFKMKNAAILNGTLGYDSGALRLDADVSYARTRARAITVDKINGSAVTLGASDASDFCDYTEYTDCVSNGNSIEFKGGTKLRQLNALANLWYDIPTGGRLEPYLGGGIGIAGFKIDGEGKSRFAWQIGAGVAYKLSPHFALTADFRHRQAAKLEDAYDDGSGFQVGRVKTTSYGLGIRATF